MRISRSSFVDYLSLSLLLRQILICLNGHPGRELLLTVSKSHFEEVSFRNPDPGLTRFGGNIKSQDIIFPPQGERSSRSFAAMGTDEGVGVGLRKPTTHPPSPPSGAVDPFVALKHIDAV